MAKFLHTSKISKAHQDSYDGKPFYVVPAFGEGNCALNAFSLACVDLIKQDKLQQLDADKQQLFMLALADKRNLEILRRRQAQYAAAESDMAVELMQVIKAIEANANHFAGFCQFVKNHSNSRAQVAALHVGLAPALREIGASMYKHALSEVVQSEKKKSAVAGDDPVHAEHLAVLEKELEDADHLYADGASAGNEILVPLARDFFRINIRLYEQNTKKPIVYINPARQEVESVEVSPRPNESIPEVNLLHIPGHWDYLLPVSQTTGLAAGNALSDKEKTAVPVVEEIEPTQEIMAATVEIVSKEKQQETLFRLNTSVIKNNLHDVSELMDQANHNLIALHSDSSPDANYHATVQQHEAATSAIVKTVRDHLQVTKASLDQLSPTMRSMQKQILLGEEENGHVKPVTKQIESDARLARALQNAEIVAFFDRHYRSLSGAKAPSKADEPTIHSSDKDAPSKRSR